jgi:hypothetical protein
MCCAKKKLAKLEAEIADLKARLERLESPAERGAVPELDTTGPDWNRIRHMDGMTGNPYPIEDYLDLR